MKAIRHVAAGAALTLLAARLRSARRVRVQRVEVSGYTAHCHVAGEGADLVLLASPRVRARGGFSSAATPT